MSKYVIGMKLKETNDASLKPKSDINKILENDFDFKKIEIINFPRFNSYLFKKIRLKIAFKNNKLNNGDIVIMHYPLYIGKKFQKMIVNYVHNSGAKIVAFIHDIDSIRNLGDFKNIEEESKFLNSFDAIISSNKFMTNLLNENGFNKPHFELKIFDYLSTENHKQNDTKDKEMVTFAGNLNKSKFLLNYKDDLILELYGNCDYEDKLNKRFNYHGSVSPSELTKKLGQGFGLVWDGNSTDSITGLFGEYLRYNDPYKASMYLSVGMPLIVWNDSAISNWVKENDCGISVSSISNLNDVLAKISNEKFKQLCKNANLISNKLRNGYYTKNVVNKLLNYFGN